MLLRLVLILAAFAVFNYLPYISLLCVLCFELLDMFDGYIARRTKTVSSFGTIADMILDRLTPIFCFSVLIVIFPKWASLFALLLAADLLGHMAMLYCALLSRNIQHHKLLFRSHNKILDLYYADKGLRRFVMVFCIAGYDLAMVSLIIIGLKPGVINLYFLQLILLWGASKVIIHLLHIYYSFKISLSIQPM